MLSPLWIALLLKVQFWCHCHYEFFPVSLDNSSLPHFSSHNSLFTSLQNVVSNGNNIQLMISDFLKFVNSLRVRTVLSSPLFFFVVFFFCVYLFTYEREREQMRDRKRGKRRIPSRLCTISAEPNAGLEFMNCEIMTWAKINSQTFNLPSHPDDPIFVLLVAETATSVFISDFIWGSVTPTQKTFSRFLCSQVCLCDYIQYTKC